MNGGDLEGTSFLNLLFYFEIFLDGLMETVEIPEVANPWD
jgi:hypothetical protein